MAQDKINCKEADQDSRTKQWKVQDKMLREGINVHKEEEL